MLRVAALYDIHGNLPALEAVLEDVGREDVDRVLVGGDVVPGPMAPAVLERLLSLNVPVDFIYGNGETEVLRASRGDELVRVPPPHRPLIEWTASQFDRQQLDMMAKWPLTVRYSVDGLGEVVFCHATPRDDNEIFTRLTPVERLRPLVADLGATLVVCGHTHMPFDRAVGDTRIVNAGSIGMPFGDAGADWLLLGPDVRFRHTNYDAQDAAARIRATNYPQADDFAVRYVLTPPSEAQMLGVFGEGNIGVTVNK
jgi:putative phosphoesterase